MEDRSASKKPPEKHRDSAIIAASDAMKRVVQRATQAAAYDLPVLITGEIGTGKGLIASYIHENSARHREPVKTVSCGMLMPDLAASELFGHVKGAFTGASYDRPGAWVEAHCGTLVLDDVDLLPLQVQAGVVRAIENREVHPIGSRIANPADVRLICTTTLDLMESSVEGSFRSDLYFRLAGFLLAIPPLRDRPEDIQSLVTQYITTYCKKHNASQPKLSKKMLSELLAYDWPGNVRELLVQLEMAIVLSGGSKLDFELPSARRRKMPAKHPTSKHRKSQR
ncbi:MAG: sigma-54-dependent Fis family transcriptional regulator [Deltaproteobacteria bacterium]|nr:sigma-54-dependent Fis family transcriptional regulator [Deltaproteobacteria bacterium]